MAGSQYSNIKILYHFGNLEYLKKGFNPVPVHVNLVISDRCNHNCSFCAYRSSGYPTSQMFMDHGIAPVRIIPTDRALDLIKELKVSGVKAIQFTGGGEPTMHPDFYFLLRCAQSYKIDTALVTNGQNLNEKNRKELMSSIWIRISLDAGTSYTHSSMRRISPTIFEKVLDNTRKLVALRNEKKSKLYIGIGFLITKENMHEIVEATKIACDIGADSIRFSTLYSNAGASYYDGIYENIHEKLAIAQKLQTDKFKVINSFKERLNDLSVGRPEYEYCSQQRISTYIGGDQNVYRCCVTAYNKLGLLGSIKNCSFLDFWNDPETIKKLDEFNAKSCIRCQFNEKNKMANSILDELPVEHINFV